MTTHTIPEQIATKLRTSKIDIMKSIAELGQLEIDYLNKKNEIMQKLGQMANKDQELLKSAITLLDIDSSKKMTFMPDEMTIVVEE